MKIWQAIKRLYIRFKLWTFRRELQAEIDRIQARIFTKEEQRTNRERWNK